MAEKIILLSNDDGIHAPGLATAREKLRRLGRVIVVAPDRQRSGAGHSLTLDVPLRVNRLEDDVMSVTGTPTDCVLLAVRNLLNSRPDILVSGVNRGPNLGDDVTYSGTVAAAMEGTLLGIPSVAVSLARSQTDRYDYGCAAEIAVSIGRLVLERGIPPGALLNVNVPSLPMEEIKGVRITKQGKQSYDEPIVEKTDPRGRLYYWIGGPQATWEKDPDTDFAAVASGYVSVTPIDLDFTDYGAFDELRNWPLVDIAGGATAGETLGRAADTTRKDDE